MAEQALQPIREPRMLKPAASPALMHARMSPIRQGIHGLLGAAVSIEIAAAFVAVVHACPPAAVCLAFTEIVLLLLFSTAQPARLQRRR